MLQDWIQTFMNTQMQKISCYILKIFTLSALHNICIDMLLVSLLQKKKLWKDRVHVMQHVVTSSCSSVIISAVFKA